MKKIIIILCFAISLSSCAIRVPVEKSTSSVDYSRYTEKGFFITEANAVAFNYQPVGSIEATFRSGFEVVLNNGKPIMIEGPYGTFKKTTKKFISATQSEVLEQFYKRSIEMGANGVINFKFNALTSATKNGSVSVGYQASGMAIKK